MHLSARVRRGAAAGNREEAAAQALPKIRNLGADLIKIIAQLHAHGASGAGGEALAKLGEDAAKAATKLLTAVGELFGLSEAFESSRHGSGGATGIAAAVGAAPAMVPPSARISTRSEKATGQSEQARSYAEAPFITLIDLINLQPLTDAKRLQSMVGQLRQESVRVVTASLFGAFTTLNPGGEPEECRGAPPAALLRQLAALDAPRAAAARARDEDAHVVHAALCRGRHALARQTLRSRRRVGLPPRHPPEPPSRRVAESVRTDRARRPRADRRHQEPQPRQVSRWRRREEGVNPARGQPERQPERDDVVSLEDRRARLRHRLPPEEGGWRRDASRRLRKASGATSGSRRSKTSEARRGA